MNVYVLLIHCFIHSKSQLPPLYRFTHVCMVFAKAFICSETYVMQICLALAYVKSCDLSYSHSCINTYSMQIWFAVAYTESKSRVYPFHPFIGPRDIFTKDLSGHLCQAIVYLQKYFTIFLHIWFTVQS